MLAITVPVTATDDYYYWGTSTSSFSQSGAGGSVSGLTILTEARGVYMYQSGLTGGGATVQYTEDFAGWGQTVFPSVGSPVVTGGIFTHESSIAGLGTVYAVDTAPITSTVLTDTTTCTTTRYTQNETGGIVTTGASSTQQTFITATTEAEHTLARLTLTETTYAIAGITANKVRIYAETDEVLWCFTGTGETGWNYVGGEGWTSATSTEIEANSVSSRNVTASYFTGESASWVNLDATGGLTWHEIVTLDAYATVTLPTIYDGVSTTVTEPRQLTTTSVNSGNLVANETIVVAAPFDHVTETTTTGTTVTVAVTFTDGFGGYDFRTLVTTANTTHTVLSFSNPPAAGSYSQTSSIDLGGGSAVHNTTFSAEMYISQFIDGKQLFQLNQPGFEQRGVRLRRLPNGGAQVASSYGAGAPVRFYTGPVDAAVGFAMQGGVPVLNDSTLTLNTPYSSYRVADLDGAAGTEAPILLGVAPARQSLPELDIYPRGIYRSAPYGADEITDIENPGGFDRDTQFVALGNNPVLVENLPCRFYYTANDPDPGAIPPTDFELRVVAKPRLWEP